MEQHEFENYENYLSAQRRITRLKVGSRKDGLAARPEALKGIADHFEGAWMAGSRYSPVGLCHGVRRGLEIDYFELEIGGEWKGTEIYKPLCDGNRIINRDFDDVPEDWIEAVDIIYSNSFDHSRNPDATLNAWMSELTPGGFLYLEWTPYHNVLGPRSNKADCFAASLTEYVDLLQGFGLVESFSRYYNHRKKDFTVFILRKPNG